MTSSAAPIRCALVMEQTLGHVTHMQNLRDVTAGFRDVFPIWLPIPFEIRGVGRLMPLFNNNWTVRASWRARRALAAAAAAGPVDAVLFHTQVTALGSLGMMRRIPSVISLDATPINYDSVGHHYGHRAAGDGFIDRRKLAQNRRAFHAAAGLVTWSEWARRSLGDDYGVDPSNVRVLAPGASAAFFDIGVQRIFHQPVADAPGRLPRLLFVGGDFRRKGGLHLLECMHGPLGDRCELHIVTRDQVDAQRNVYVHHEIGPNDPALLALFADADIFVLPSLADCLALVLMEATASALPVITTDVGALAEAIRPGETGLLVRAGDSMDLGRAIEALVDDADTRRRMGRAGRSLARQKFDARQNGRALIDIVIEAANRDRRTRSSA
jgi:glycosyltransferase involved in cell wall biosynthesis